MSSSFSSYIQRLDTQKLPLLSPPPSSSLQEALLQPNENFLSNGLIEEKLIKQPSIKKFNVLKTEEDHVTQRDKIEAIRLIYLHTEFKKRNRVKYYDPERYIKGLK